MLWENHNEPDERPARTLKHRQILSGKQRGRGEENWQNPRILAQVHKPESFSQPKTKQAGAHGFKFHLRHRGHSPDHAGLRPLPTAEPLLPARDPTQAGQVRRSPGVQLSSAGLHTSLGEGVIREESPGAAGKSCPQATDTETGSPQPPSGAQDTGRPGWKWPVHSLQNTEQLLSINIPTATLLGS